MNKTISLRFFSISIQLSFIFLILTHDINFHSYLLLTISSTYIFFADEYKVGTISEQHIIVYKRLVFFEKILVFITVLLIIVKYLRM